jgi:hypothetical protein
MIDPTIAAKRRSGFFDKSTDDTIEKRTMTLEQMMNLPEENISMHQTRVTTKSLTNHLISVISSTA